MFEKLIEYFLTQPNRLISAGQALLSLGSLTCIAGLAGRVAIVGATSLQRLGGKTTLEVELAMLYPALPTWWIPEGAFGFSMCAVLILAGLTLTKLANDMKRMINA